MSTHAPFAVLALVVLLSGLPAQRATSRPAAAPGYFQTEIAFQHDAKLGGCAIGDLDPRHPGQEIVAVSVRGEVFVLHLERGYWHSELVYRCGGEALQCAIGDLRPSRPGLELLVVGMARGTEDDGGPGAAHVVHWDGEAWQGTKLLEEPALIHGVTIGPRAALLVGFTQEALVVDEREGELGVRARVRLPGNGKTAVPLPRAKGTAPGGESGPQADPGFVVACSDGSLVRVFRAGDETSAVWQAETLHEREAGRARLAVSPAGAILSADDDGALVLIDEKGARIVHQEGAKLRGAAFGSFVPSHPVPGPQLASVGYAGEIVVLLPRDDATFVPHVLFRDLQRFHHLAAGTLGPRPGLALAGCGYAGRVVVARWVE